MPKRGLEPPHLTIYAPKAYVATITPLGLVPELGFEPAIFFFKGR